MKTNNLAKRKNNIIIATLVSVFCFILNALLFLGIRLLNISLFPKIILFVVLFLYTLFILPKLLLKLQDSTYNYLCKNIDIIESNLSDDYTPIYLNVDCLKKSSIPFHAQRKYFAKLEDDGKVTIKIVCEYNNEFFIEKTSDYSWFLAIFRFNE